MVSEDDLDDVSVHGSFCFLLKEKILSSKETFSTRSAFTPVFA